MKKEKREEKLKKKAEEIVGVLKDIDEIGAISLSGGLARGLVDEYSDIDLVCFCEEMPEEKDRRKALEKLGIDNFINDELPDFKTRRADYFFIDDIKASLYCVRIDKHKELVEKVVSGEASKEEFSDVIDRIYYAEELYDPKNIIQEWKGEIPKPRQDKRVIKKLVYKLNRVRKGKWPHGEKIRIETLRENPITVDKKFIGLIDFYLIVLFTLNNEYYTYPKHLPAMLDRLEKKPENCLERLNKLAYLGNDKKSVKKKMKVLEGLVRDLEEILEEE